jgi:hypothetical protein
MNLALAKEQFMANCVSVVEALGSYGTDIPLHVSVNGKTYTDDIIDITLSEDKLYMEVIRVTTNEQIMNVVAGDLSMFKGDFIYLEDHINKLVDELD